MTDLELATHAALTAGKLLKQHFGLTPPSMKPATTTSSSRSTRSLRNSSPKSC